MKETDSEINNRTIYKLDSYLKAQLLETIEVNMNLLTRFKDSRIGVIKTGQIWKLQKKENTNKPAICCRCKQVYEYAESKIGFTCWSCSNGY